jgi:hypothetical protein
LVGASGGAPAIEAVRLNGAFGAFIPVGIRIGQDALQPPNAQPRWTSSTPERQAPCTCVADLPAGHGASEWLRYGGSAGLLDMRK